MSFIFKCPHCGQQMTAEDEWIGKESQCAFCGKQIVIQNSASEPAASQSNEMNQPAQQPQFQPQQQPLPQPQQIYVQSAPQPAKSRVVYILLAFFLGSFGIHNFYAGYVGRGVIQLVITLLLAWLVVPAIVLFVWIVIEMITVTRDVNGVPFN